MLAWQGLIGSYDLARLLRELVSDDPLHERACATSPYEHSTCALHALEVGRAARRAYGLAYGSAKAVGPTELIGEIGIFPGRAMGRARAGRAQARTEFTLWLRGGGCRGLGRGC
jgi:hypothetical protein